MVTPFFFFIVPRITFSLHPEPVVNAAGKVDMESRMLQVLLASGVGFTALFFWMHNLQCRAPGACAGAEISGTGVTVMDASGGDRLGRRRST